ncbi:MULTISPECIES: hypothetical protein [Streptomyces]|uniref:Uncharacterized protein n=2 Tax=Streptomyces rimosus subsp. rimosus TaxID=132474 RepID=A0A8A1V046_STRR1|nr:MULTISPECIES: hypothetical protein [Streptomyces]KOG76936.1 hypothetical protein ADK78_09530 [Kitasatospora aureofaciens]KEF06640.1 hypothetical protein DF17_12785 [Streptomyces rimosus]KEF11658.1 hypothetical protein DF18_36005 [Streptomyces rimosus]KOT41482.1 hypothetical protein ADK84_11730 [Streptomyces sp. NRRL WC-3701]KOT61067.1 hypothetical protein ADK45_18695 [Streptomyces rimosus subsp. rimosus]
MGRRLTSELEALFGKELVAEFGRIYQEPASRTGAASLFPALVVDRPLKEGIEAEEVLTGREEVVVVTGAPTEGTEFEIDQVYERRVKFVRFRCDRESNEAGSDEVYWASGAAGDSQAQIVMLTPEYGEIHTGTVKNFGPDAFWCKGAAEKFVGGNIQVWEADPGGGGKNKARQVLAAIAREVAKSGLEASPSWEAVFLGLVAAAASLVGAAWRTSSMDRQQNKTGRQESAREQVLE